MRFQPKTAKELAEANLWPVGPYAFEILEAEEKTDSSDRPMFALKVKVFKESGASQNIFDYVSPAWMEFKLRHLAEATDLLADYEQGEMEAYQLVGKTGKCKVNISKDKSGQYPDKNGIADYLVEDGVSFPEGSALNKKPNPDDDTIPF